MFCIRRPSFVTPRMRDAREPLCSHDGRFQRSRRHAETKALRLILAHSWRLARGPTPASRGLAFAGTGARRVGICSRCLIEDQITARKASATFPPAIRTAATAVCPASIVCARAVLRRVPLCCTATVSIPPPKISYFASKPSSAAFS